MKIIKKSQTLLVSVTLILFSAACGQISSTDLATQPQTSGNGTDSGAPDPDGSKASDGPWDPRPPEEIHDQEKANRVCYPGNGAAPVCLNLVQPVDAEFRANYKYPDPRTARDFPRGFDANQYFPPTKFLRLTDFANNLPLAKNFGMQEFMSDVKGTYGVFSPYVVAALQKLRDMTRRSLTITSAFRSPSYNQAIGGASWSRHTYGDGVDIAAPDQSSKKIITASCKKLGAGFTLVYATHVHCDWRATPQATELSDEHAHPNSEIEVMEVGHEQQIENAKSADEVVQAALGIQVQVSGAGKSVDDDGMFSTAAVKRRQVALSATYLDIEGEGVPDLEWTITSTNGKALGLAGQDVVFEGKRGATYQVELLMGGHYRMTQTVHVPQR